MAASAYYQGDAPHHPVKSPSDFVWAGGGVLPAGGKRESAGVRKLWKMTSRGLE